MKKIIFIIEGNEIELKFNYGVLRLLGDRWGCKSLNDVFLKFSVFIGCEGDLTFEQLEIVGDILDVSAQNAGHVIDVDAAVGVVLSDIQKLKEIIEAFRSVLPVEDEQKKKIDQKRVKG